MTSTADIRAACSAAGRVCPKPQRWHALSQLLREHHQAGVGDPPPVPLILSGWVFTSNLEKLIRFQQQLKWAEQRGCLDVVTGFLDRLQPDDWHTFTGR
jgi:hypothetical protein